MTHVGFPALGRGDVIRAGCWTPITVDLALVDQAEFHGTLRAAQFDSDGDQCLDTVEVHLRAETGGSQRLALYVPANPVSSDGRFFVELRDQDGSTASIVSQGVLTTKAVPADPPAVVSHDDVVILSVGKGTVGKVKDLAGLQATRYRRAIVVGHIGLEDLPELWIGLESIDYVVWDDAAPADLTPRQLEALIEWVRHGGTLLVAAGRTADTFKLVRPINAILPVEIGDIVSVVNLPITREKLLGQPPAEEFPAESALSWKETPFPQPVPLARCQLREGAVGVSREETPLPSSKSAPSEIVAWKKVERGHIIFCALSLHDLFSGPGRATTFFEKLFHFIPSADAQSVPQTSISLFDNVASAVGFVTSRSAYLLFAAVFSLVYVAAATFGTWTFLSARGWRHYSWTAFAAVAAGASFISVFAVGSIRGITDRLEQMAILDADAGATFGRGTVLFGLKTGIDKRLDLWLPTDWLTAREPDVTSCFLRPLPVGQEWRPAGGSFADPEEYHLRPASAEIEGARFRATLKRFEARWEGPLGGKLSGRIGIRKGLISEESYVLNELGVELRNCRLIHTLLNPGDVAADRSTATYVFPIGDLPSDGGKVYLKPRCYALTGSQTMRDLLQASLLSEWQKAWGAAFRGLLPGFMYSSQPDKTAPLGREQDALMLVSTIGDFDPAVLSTPGGGPQTWSVDRLRQLDLREHLLGGRQPSAGNAAEAGGAVLIGFAKGGGPVRLFTRSGDGVFSAIHPEERDSWVMYRIRIPTAVLEPEGAEATGASRDSPEERVRP